MTVGFLVPRLKYCHTAFVSIALLVGSAQLAAHEGQGKVGANGRFTPNVSGAQFPPQPREMQNVQQIRPTGRDQARLITLNNFLSRALTDNDVVSALGDRYEYINSTAQVFKGRVTPNRYLSVYYSYSNNQTVNVVTRGTNVVEVTVEPAGVDQPPLTEAEMTTAIQLARDYWRGRGNAVIDQLAGYAIQTYQPDGSPYNTRMVYVSFHTESPEPPLLYSRVDLSTGAVVDGEEE